MEKNKKKLINAYEPYKLEAQHCFREEILISLICTVGLTIFDAPHIFPYAYLFLPLYFLLELVCNYSLFLLGIIEQRHHLILKAQIRILKITEDNSLSGHFGSIIPKLYPQQMMVGRYRVCCINEHGKKTKLRITMSLKKYQKLIETLINHNYQLLWTISYGRYTHIIVSFDDKNEVCSFFNHYF